MPDPRIDIDRAKAISKRLRKYKKMYGGKALVEREAGIKEQTWYRILANCCISVENAERLERFLGITVDQNV